MGKLEGRVAIVTGAGQGIGRGVALALAKEGAAVAVVEIRAEAAEHTARELQDIGARAIAVCCDVGQRAQVNTAVAATVAAFGTVDILINNAQAAKPGVSLEDITDADIDLPMNSGFYGTLYFMQACFPYLKARGGKIVNFGSGVGMEGSRGQAAYAAAKEAVRAITRVAAREWGKYGINANVVCPAAESPGMVEWKNNFPEQFQKGLRKVPLGRVGDCEKDIGRAVAFLAGPDSDFITGMTMMLDGGSFILH